MTTLLFLHLWLTSTGSVEFPGPATWFLLADSEVLATQPIAPKQDDDDSEEEDEDEGKSPEELELERLRAKLRELIRDGDGGIKDLASGDTKFNYGGFSVEYNKPDQIVLDFEYPGRDCMKNMETNPVALRGKSREEPAVCFTAHTAGHVLLRPHFKGKVEVEVELRYEWISRGATFQLTMHSDGKEFWGTEFGVHGVKRFKKNPKRKKVSTKRYPSSEKSHHADTGRWMDRTRYHILKMTYDPEKAKVTISNNGREMHAIDTEGGPSSGQIGFVWEKTRFTVMKINIKGEPDWDWVKEHVDLETGD